jgi:hypothetical protein
MCGSMAGSHLTLCFGIPHVAFGGIFRYGELNTRLTTWRDLDTSTVPGAGPGQTSGNGGGGGGGGMMAGMMQDDSMQP